ERLNDPSEMATLRRYRDEMRDVAILNIDSFGRYLDLNEAFHWAIVDLAKSPILRRTLEHVVKLPFASASALVFSGSMVPKAAEMFAIGQDQHWLIFEAIENRQGSRADSLA